MSNWQNKEGGADMDKMRFLPTHFPLFTQRGDQRKRQPWIYGACSVNDDADLGVVSQYHTYQMPLWKSSYFHDVTGFEQQRSHRQDLIELR